MITYINEVAFQGSVFRIILKLRQVTEELMVQIKQQLRFLSHDLQVLEAKLSKERSHNETLESLSGHLFVKSLQYELSDLSQHECIANITYYKV